MNPRVPANTKYIVTLAAAAAVILLVGSLLRPPPRHEEQPPPSETDLARLTRLTQRRSLDTMTAYFTGVADESAQHLVALPHDGTTGVVWDDAGTIATARVPSAPPASLEVMTTDGMARSTALTWAPDIPVLGIRATRVVGVPPLRSTLPLKSGEWLVAVWKTRENTRAFAPTTYLETAPGDCGGMPGGEVHSTLTLTRLMVGGGVFDMDGRLVGVILPCGNRNAAFVPEHIDALLAKAESFESRLLARYGLVLGPLTGDETTYFGVTPASSSDIVVRQVWTGFPGQASGMRPGDVIVSLNGQRISVTSDLQRLVTGGDAPVPVLEVRRDGVNVQITLGGNTDDREPVVEAHAAERAWPQAEGGYRASDVLDERRAVASGIAPDDRILRVGRTEPRSLDAAQRLLAGTRGGPVFLELERNGRRWGALLGKDGQ